ncbi:response regulator [Zavarzinella formosa]|uniref:response regulator n=1 Tax=Zavarzinella formosa TaxID=360055 RepID=UPI0002F10D85|nr:response regulator [Zavarzinella formosa]
MTTAAIDPVYFLLVDDLEENLLALEALLRRDGLVLLKARTGSDALELLLRHEIALALVDVQMPGMDGFELAELMRGTERTRRVPIIFLTAGNSDWNRRFRGYEAGAVDFLHKPLEPDILRSKAGVFFELGRQRQELARQRDELRTATEENARLLRESRKHAEALAEAGRRKDEFLAMLAHELRNPLAPVRNAVEILRLAAPTEKAAYNAREIIARQVAHMARLVDDLLDVARIVRGQIRLLPKECDLAQLVRQTAEDHRPTLTKAGLTLGVYVPDRPLPVSGDPVRLAQMVGNLLHNAGKFTPSGGRVEVTVASDSASDSAIVTVRDNGTGMDSNVLAGLFEPFNQGVQNLDRSQGGLGLGLALVRGLVELHGGSATAESEGLGLGSTFTLRLPMTSNVAADHSPTAGQPETLEVSGLGILVIEDNQDAAESLRMLLTLLGHRVNVAFDSQTGLAAAHEFRPDVVLSDLGLPGGTDGFGVARAMRADPALAGAYLIALSGYGQEEDRQRTQEAGFDRHLIKPVELDCLQETLAAVPRRDRLSRV